MIREILEEQRDRIIDDTRLADMSNSQLNAVADGLAKMIDLATEEHEGAAPMGLIQVAPLDIIDQRLRVALGIMNPTELKHAADKVRAARPKKVTPKKVTTKRTAKKASKKR